MKHQTHSSILIINAVVTSTTETSFEKGAVVDDENEPTSPVVISETKTIEATVAECPNMNYLLQSCEIGE